MYRRVLAAAIALLAVTAATGCGNDTPDASSSAPAGAYSTITFIVPLTVVPAPGLKSPPLESARTLTWTSAATADDKVSFLAPVAVYPSGSTTASIPPDQLAQYLETLKAAGVTVADKTSITVGGRPATLMTVTTTGSLSDAFGCPQGADPAAGCFGPLPASLLRLAVVTTTSGTMLAWARVPSAGPDPAFFTAFEEMLGTVQFR
ncbi:hypothetical protein GCM10010168_37230 [Actinoplanes ianthinogenes]|uniref:Lipoprotein LpqN n=1 Tax=Actinoplanes ianthinogenes TaxID=122358 RepID=A0ABN6CNF1_9ACTN|nr:hypothetical protein [Actinoplanes ianthinogenes]BCJ46755.1 hypothetical protein Aiant_74120 [Actinoplanes ianthinogenes]GGR15822.1 hypothetical protein GCM10010168_37230 [Actinoplanes ianthinogenes]